MSTVELYAQEGLVWDSRYAFVPDSPSEHCMHWIPPPRSHPNPGHIHRLPPAVATSAIDYLEYSGDEKAEDAECEEPERYKIEKGNLPKPPSSYSSFACEKGSNSIEVVCDAGQRSRQRAEQRLTENFQEEERNVYFHWEWKYPWPKSPEYETHQLSGGREGRQAYVATW